MGCVETTVKCQYKCLAKTTTPRNTREYGFGFDSSVAAGAVMELNDNMRGVARCVRHHAKEYGVDPNRLGVAGGSARGLLVTRAAVKSE